MSNFFKTTFANNVVYLNQERGLVYIPSQQIDPEAGNNGEVFKGYIGYNTDQQKECCVKKFKMPSYPQNKELIEKLNLELVFGKQLNHKNIVSCYECSTSQNNFYIFMEYCDGGSLAQMMHLGYEDNLMSTKIFPEDQALDIICQIVDALIYMKQFNFQGKSGVVHRDIKPDNIMFSKNVPKLIDFGMARFMDNRDITLFQGSPIYMSPQNLAKQKYNLELNDVWSLGIILYQLVEGVFPWRMELNSLEDLQIAQESIRHNIVFSDKTSLSLQNLIRNMLKIEEKDRYNWDQVINDEALIPYVLNNMSEEVRYLNKLYSNYILYQDLQNKLKTQKLEKYVLDLTLTKIFQYKQFIQKNSFIDKKIESLYILRIQQNRKFHTFKGEASLKRKLEERLVKYLEQMKLDNITGTEFEYLTSICSIVISLYKSEITFDKKVSIQQLLVEARL